MSQVELTTLGESCEFFNGKAHEKDIDVDGKYIVVNSKFISQEGRVIKRTKEQMFPLFKDDIVMVMSDVPNGKALAKCFIVDQDDTYSLNQRICCIRSKEFDTKYLYYQLNRHEHFLAFNNGENQTNLRKDDILACPLIKPSMEKQRRIVSELESSLFSLDQAKGNAEKNLQNAKEIFESYLQRVFENENWEVKRFEELIQENQIGLIKSTREQGKEKPYRYLKMDSITADNYLIHDKYVYVNADKDELNKYTLNEGDFLFNTRNSFDLVGKTCVYRPIDDEPTLFNNNIMRVVFKKGILSSFINYAFCSNLVKERLQKLKSGTTSVVGIYYKGLRNLQIPVANFDEQQSTIRQLDELRTETQKLETLYQKKMAALDELKKGILQKAFQLELESEKELKLV